jgi:hypothetical protein
MIISLAFVVVVVRAPRTRKLSISPGTTDSVAVAGLTATGDDQFSRWRVWKVAADPRVACRAPVRGREKRSERSGCVARPRRLKTGGGGTRLTGRESDARPNHKCANVPRELEYCSSIAEAGPHHRVIQR